MVEGSNPSGPIKDRAAFLVQFWVLLSIIAIIPYIPAILLSMVELFLTVAGATAFIVHLDIICAFILFVSWVISSIIAAILEFFFVLLISWLRLSFLF